MHTSFFSNKSIANDKYFPVRISIGHPRFKLRYKIENTFSELFPKREWFELSQKEYCEKYLEQLENNADTILNKMKELPENTVLLCFEKLFDGTWCHRTIFSVWYQDKTGIEIEELPTI